MVFQLKCSLCGSRYWNNERHECSERRKPKLTEEGHLTPKEQQVIHAALRRSVKIVSDPVSKPKRKEKLSTERSRRWREANREKARVYQRNYMRKWRSNE